ncbi:LacI family DNA-binding transcriptional regulator [Streptomyces sp. DSM 44915]|uniref:LacI family DNA-binding transcriptional regulator n=1 Tax=Streptomyces chisholmiae TaxID=3075540 RepID=A0ABU2JTV1_9ACTN|nr:LacI family DNA-binding transcriptional regulator [Streptomyces sp. DSM 44915]MDT0268409.1 LacI family DNA-binding transcriptional regulator [Streptomyces sp. DSM 44915]
MVTIKDVARRAGVAPSTVSYVLSGSRKISEETRATVRAAIEELGYHPRASARTLRRARSEVLVLAVPREPGKYRSVDGRFAIDIGDMAREHGYDLLLMTERDGVRGLVRLARSGLADGAMLMAVRERDPRVEALRALGFPTALLGHGAPDEGDDPPWVDLDWAAAVSLAVRETVAAGHRRILFWASADHEFAARNGFALHGLAGAEAAARESGAEVLVRRSTVDPVELRARLRAVLTATPRPTALLVQHLIPLPLLLDEIAALGLRVPEDLAVVLVGSLPDEAVPRPLPRIDLPVGRMAEAVVRLVVAAIEAPDRSGGPGPPELIAPRLADGPPVAPPGG